MTDDYEEPPPKDLAEKAARAVVIALYGWRPMRHGFQALDVEQTRELEEQMAQAIRDTLAQGFP